jgi:hypothetical protein
VLVVEHRRDADRRGQARIAAGGSHPDIMIADLVARDLVKVAEENTF